MWRVSQLLRFVVPAAALLLGPALTASCGPSVQSIYEGDVRFEHCYRLDLELDVATTHRQACWTTWLDRYTYGQSRDRLPDPRPGGRGLPRGGGVPPPRRARGYAPSPAAMSTGRSYVSARTSSSETLVSSIWSYPHPPACTPHRRR